MKTSRVTIALIPFFIASVFIFFTSTAFNAYENEAKPQPAISSCTYYFELIFAGTVSFDPYTVCINGVYAFQTSGDFRYEIPCNETTVICISNGTYYGTVTLNPKCPCEDTHVYVGMNESSEECICRE